MHVGLICGPGGGRSQPEEATITVLLHVGGRPGSPAWFLRPSSQGGFPRGLPSRSLEGGSTEVKQTMSEGQKGTEFLVGKLQDYLS